MADNKRKHDDDPQSSRRSKKSRPGPSVEPRVDPTYGQRSAIPGLDDEVFGDEDELDYSEDMGALAYLRSVRFVKSFKTERTFTETILLQENADWINRQEATGIPHLLVAPGATNDNGRTIYENGIGDFRGRYEDGAYVAFIDSSPSSTEKDQSNDPQVSYYSSIFTRHETLRDQLQRTPPPEAIERLGKGQKTRVQNLSRDISKLWNNVMRTTNPVPAQVASMDKSSVLRLLRLLTNDKMLKRGMSINPTVSHWMWSLLARLPERGELASEEIGVVRELGKKAVLVGTGLREEKDWEAGMEEVEAGLKGESNAREETSGFDADVGEEDDGFDVVNEDEIELDLDHEFSADLDSNSNAPQNAESGVEEQSDGEQGVENQPGDEHAGTAAEETANEPEDLEAIKARLMGRLTTHEVEFSVNLEPEIMIEIEPVLEGTMDPEALKWNTKATVDMIITVAGEVYGQRDLLEFRSIWESSM